MPDIDGNMPSDVVTDELFEDYAMKHGLSASGDSVVATMFALRFKISRALAMVPMLNIDPSGEGFYLQVSGGRNDGWKVDEEIEKEYCEGTWIEFWGKSEFRAVELDVHVNH
jgi:DNA/RNA endonuclease G (NUC1)